jgi:site-specific DNA-adenine methylase
MKKSKRPRAFNYFGSKVNSAPRYPKPRYARVIEPFAGGAGYSLYHQSHEVVLFDKNPDIIRAWNYLIDTDPNEVRKLPLLAPGQLVSSLPIDDEAKIMIRWTTHMTTYGMDRLSNWGEINNSEGNGGYWGEIRREQMARFAWQVKHWKAFIRSYEDIENEEATWFIDPPYEGLGESYPFWQIDYPNLAKWCRSRRGQVIVCERSGATWLPFKDLYRMPTMDAQTGSRGQAIEAMWTND